MADIRSPSLRLKASQARHQSVARQELCVRAWWPPLFFRGERDRSASRFVIHADACPKGFCGVERSTSAKPPALPEVADNKSTSFPVIFFSPKAAVDCSHLHERKIVILDSAPNYTQVIARAHSRMQCLFHHPALRHARPRDCRACAQRLDFVRRAFECLCRRRPLPDPEIFKLGAPIWESVTGCNCWPNISAARSRKVSSANTAKARLRVNDSFLPALRQSAGEPASLEFPRRQADENAARIQAVAVTENSDFAAWKNGARKIFACNSIRGGAHARGREILANFVHNICGCGKNWTMHTTSTRRWRPFARRWAGRRWILGLSAG